MSRAKSSIEIDSPPLKLYVLPYAAALPAMRASPSTRSSDQTGRFFARPSPMKGTTGKRKR
jgi:hypothetical protein